MRTELWGLRDKATHEPIYTYWASSNKYRALFVNKGTAESACHNPRNPNMEPFCITGDPIHAAGGCYCRECRRCDGFPGPDIEKDEVGICHIDMTTVPPYGFCKWGVPKEARP